jgi:hypothetical protein
MHTAPVNRPETDKPVCIKLGAVQNAPVGIDEQEHPFAGHRSVGLGPSLRHKITVKLEQVARFDGYLTVVFGQRVGELCLNDDAAPRFPVL